MGPKKEWILTSRFLGHRWIVLLFNELIQLIKEMNIFLGIKFEILDLFTILAVLVANNEDVGRF